MDNTERLLKQQMKDSDSMVIRSSYMLQRKDGQGNTIIDICGIVDGKNSFGGFTGGSRFTSESTASTLDTFDTGAVKIEGHDLQELADKVGMLISFDLVYWNPQCVDPAHPAVAPKAKEI